jgi:hypothetical protein
MAFSMIHDRYVAASRQYAEAQQAGTAIGGAIGGAAILFMWVAGAVILGLLALLTRGRKTVVIRNAT